MCLETEKHLCINFTLPHSASKSFKSIQPRSQHCHLENCPQGISTCTPSSSTSAFLPSTAAWAAAGGLAWRQENGVGEHLCVFQVSLQGEEKSAYLLGEWGNRVCIPLRYLGSHSSVGCLYFQLGERSNKAWRIYVSFYPPAELVPLMVKWSGFQHCNLPLIFLLFYWAKGIVSLSSDLE